MSRSKLKANVPRALFFVAAWILFTVALLGWWVSFVLRHFTRLAALDPDAYPMIATHQRMLVWEGSALVLLVVGGGIALLYYIWREPQRNQQLKQFFATFTHEIKTPIASIRLQAESLREDLKSSEEAKLTERLLKDTVRLEHQIENSLFLANLEEFDTLHMEHLSLQSVIGRVQGSYDGLSIQCKKDCKLWVDVRAIETILKNIVSNAVVHGAATNINVGVTQTESGQVDMEIEDNGTGFQGKIDSIGTPFVRHTSTSGSGLGLYLVRSLTEKMNGSVSFYPQPARGMKIRLSLVGVVQ